jgi:hypothetical protein
MDTCDLYGVSLDIESGNFYGYAWSPDLGWINFNGANMYNLSWFQERYSDIYSQGNIGSIFTGKAPGYATAEVGRCNATYLIQANGSITNFCSSGYKEKVGPADTASTTAVPKELWRASDMSARGFGYIGFPQKNEVSGTYTNVFGTIDYQGLITIVNPINLKKNKYNIVVDKTINNLNKFIYRTAPPVNLGNSLDGKIYFSNTYNINFPLQFNNQTGTNNGSGLIVIDGDLNINSDMDYGYANGLSTAVPLDNIKNLASAGFIVKGDVTIAPTVKHIVGNYFIDGTVTVQGKASGRNDDQLQVSGLIIARQFKFQRQFKGTIDNPQPAEVIIYDGRLLANTPPGFQDLASLLPLIREVSP